VRSQAGAWERVRQKLGNRKSLSNLAGASLATAASGAVHRLDGGHYVSRSNDGRDIGSCDHCRSDGCDGSDVCGSHVGRGRVRGHVRVAATAAKRVSAACRDDCHECQNGQADQKPLHVIPFNEGGWAQSRIPRSTSPLPVARSDCLRARTSSDRRFRQQSCLQHWRHAARGAS